MYLRYVSMSLEAVEGERAARESGEAAAANSFILSTKSPSAEEAEAATVKAALKSPQRMQ